MGRLVLIDGNSLINRAYYALPPLNNADGVPTQAVFGFATILIKTIQDYRPDSIAVAFDLPGATFRHELYDGYKKGRKGMPDDLAVQMPILKTMLRLMGITIAEKQGFEADDVIGTLSKRHSGETLILTGDRDALQLVDDRIGVMLTKRGITDVLLVNQDNIAEHFGLSARQIIDYKALAGDSSDQIPGVPGVGDKTALDLLSRFSTLDGIYAHIDEIGGKLHERLIDGKDSAYLSYKLATIDTAVSLDVNPDACAYSFPFSLEVKNFFIRNNFKSLVKRGELFSESEVPTAQKNADIKSDYVHTEITDIAELNAVLTRQSEVLAFFMGQSSAVFSFDGKNEYRVPVNRTLIDRGIEEVEIYKAFMPVFENKSVRKIFFDAKAVLKCCKNAGVSAQNFDDIKLMQFLCDHTKEHETLPLMLEASGRGTECLACEMLALRADLIGEIKQKNMTQLYDGVELPLISVLFAMEQAGVEIDMALLDELGAKFTREAELLAKQIYELAGERFNINSPKQLAEVLFEKLSIPYPKRTKKYSTGAEILEQLEGEYEIAGLVLKYRLWMKLNGTYIEGMRKLIGDDGAVHTEFKQMLTTTGRLSSVEPNLQNIPVREDEGRQLRGLFRARAGKVLICADYSQIELRLLAHFSKDPKMLALFREGEDLHKMTAAEVFDVPPEKVTDKMRREAKTINFGIIYGMGEYGLSQNLKCPVSVARRYIDTYFEKFSAIKTYFNDIVEMAQKTGYTVTLLNRIRKIPELHSANYMTRQFGVRAAMNMPLQGSAADIIKIAMVRVHERLQATGARLILQIHDELIVEADENAEKEITKLLRECMESAYPLDVPLLVSVKSGKNWLSCE